MKTVRFIEDWKGTPEIENSRTTFIMNFLVKYSMEKAHGYFCFCFLSQIKKNSFPGTILFTFKLSHL